MNSSTNTKLNTNELVKGLLSKLSKKERDIVSRRFGLKDSERETLEAVGKLHSLTRERIRQIENATIKKLKELKDLKESLLELSNKTGQILSEHGGLAEREYLFHLLNTFSPVEYRSQEYDVEKNHYDFILSRILSDEYEEVKGSELFKHSYKFKTASIEHLEDLAVELVKKVQEMKQVSKTEDIISLLTGTDVYGRHKEKINIPGELKVSSYWQGAIYDEDHDVVHNNKVLYSLLQAVREVEQNKFGFWGVHDGEEIAPKTINHKIYLVLKNQTKPMHFVDIAKRINEVCFDRKLANPATVHNELILDPKYVLVGRGIYGLKEWGYKEGVVQDVITQILKENGPLTKDEIVNKVLENRLVKKTTISLALMNKDVFEKAGEKYQVKK
jgi:hypothetical protein